MDHLRARDYEGRERVSPTWLAGRILLCAVLLERGQLHKESEDAFFAAVSSRADTLDPRITALVAGRRFVDASGGRVKRDYETIGVNPSAKFPLTREVISEVFSKNYASLTYPLFGLGTLLSIGEPVGDAK